MSDLTVSVCVDLCKGSQSKTDAILRASKAHVSKERRDHQVLICGVSTAKEEQRSINNYVFVKNIPEYKILKPSLRRCFSNRVQLEM